MSEVVPGLNTRNWRSRVKEMTGEREHKLRTSVQPVEAVSGKNI